MQARLAATVLLPSCGMVLVIRIFFSGRFWRSWRKRTARKRNFSAPRLPSSATETSRLSSRMEAAATDTDRDPRARLVLEDSRRTPLRWAAVRHDSGPRAFSVRQPAAVPWPRASVERLRSGAGVFRLGPLQRIKYIAHCSATRNRTRVLTSSSRFCSDCR